MVKENWKSPVHSLFSLSIEYIVNNLAFYANSNFGQLKILPPHIRNRILKKFTSSSYFWQNVDFKEVLCATVNQNTKHINLTSATVDDDILKILAGCKNVERLYLIRNGNSHITSTELINLLRCTTKLGLFIITYCDEVTDDVLECLAEHCPSLTGLDIGGCKNITDEGIKKLSRLKNLTYLTLSQTKITDEGVSRLVTGNSGKNIKELRLDNCLNVTQAGFRMIAENCLNIATLMLDKCSTDTDQTMFEDGHLKNLKQLTWTVTW